MSNESQAEINQRLASGIASNTAAITAEFTRASEAENRFSRYKGVKATIAELPTEGNTNGDLWYVTANGHGYFWNTKTTPAAWNDAGVITQGADGYSPVVSVTSITGGHRVVITDSTHRSPGHSFDVMDGTANMDEQPTSGSNNTVKSGGVYSFVNSSIASATSFFKGTLDATTDLSLTKPAEKEQVQTALNAKTFTPAVANNDYCYVVNTDLSNNTIFERYKATKNDDIVSWSYEYTLNNSSFTAAQYAAVTSGITSSKVSSYDTAVSTLGTHTATTNIHTPIEVVSSAPSEPTTGTIYFITGS